MTLNPSDRHLRFLEQKIFQIEGKWPHYRGLLDGLASVAAACAPEDRVLCLERAFIFGGRSLFKPLFPRGTFFAYDVRLQGLEAERMGYQRHWVEEEPDCIVAPVDGFGPVTELPLEGGSQDWVIVPNVVHHIRNQAGMWAEVARVLRPGGRGFVFETLLRELHQAPHDFVRYTPWGFEAALEPHGLRLERWEPAGGPFEAIAYCWDQALQYLPEGLREEKARWFREQHFPELMAMEQAAGPNRVRQHTSFPIAYGLHFIRD